MSIPKEIELKLAVPEKVGARFRAHLETLPSTSHELSSNYFDTPTQRLQRYGLELRIRRDGNGFTQTMKRRLNGSPDFAREELECPLDAPSPRLDMLCRFLANKAWNRVEREGIAPVFSTCFHRVSTDRHVGNGRVELSLDTGTITAGTSALPISELEIELKSGAAGDFYEACEMLIDEWNLGLVIESKSDRGFRLLGGRPPEAFHGDKPRLNAGVTVDAALDVLLCGAFSHFLMNHPIVLAEAPEGVHQMRVGLRRLRSTLSTFKPAIAQDTLAPLLTEMRSLFKELGAVREADVFIMETLPEAKRKGLPADIASKLRRAVAIHRSKDFAILAKRLQGPAFARFVVGLGKWIESAGWQNADDTLLRLRQGTRIEEFLGPRLDKAYRKVQKRAKQAMRGTLDDWHRVRVEVKRVRYVSEHLSGVYGKDAETFAATLRRLQEDLGHLNDLATIDGLLERVEADASPSRQPVMRDARLFFAGWRGGQEKALSAELAREGRKLSRTSGFW